jgi:hypothetical protein
MFIIMFLQLRIKKLIKKKLQIVKMNEVMS